MGLEKFLTAYFDGLKIETSGNKNAREAMYCLGSRAIGSDGLSDGL